MQRESYFRCKGDRDYIFECSFLLTLTWFICNRVRLILHHTGLAFLQADICDGFNRNIWLMVENDLHPQHYFPFPCGKVITHKTSWTWATSWTMHGNCVGMYKMDHAPAMPRSVTVFRDIFGTIYFNSKDVAWKPSWSPIFSGVKQKKLLFTEGLFTS